MVNIEVIQVPWLCCRRNKVAVRLNGGYISMGYIHFIIEQDFFFHKRAIVRDNFRQSLTDDFYMTLTDTLCVPYYAHTQTDTQTHTD